MKSYVRAGVVLQLAVVAAAAVLEPVYLLAPLLGPAIAFLLGVAYGAAVPRTLGVASRGGLVIGLAGALAATVPEALGSRSLVLLAYLPVASSATGLLGGIVGMVAAGRHRKRDADAVTDPAGLDAPR